MLLSFFFPGSLPFIGLLVMLMLEIAYVWQNLLAEETKEKVCVTSFLMWSETAYHVCDRESENTKTDG